MYFCLSDRRSVGGQKGRMSKQPEKKASEGAGAEEKKNGEEKNKEPKQQEKKASEEKKKEEKKLESKQCPNAKALLQQLKRVPSAHDLGQVSRPPFSSFFAPLSFLFPHSPSLCFAPFYLQFPLSFPPPRFCRLLLLFSFRGAFLPFIFLPIL